MSGQSVPYVRRGLRAALCRSLALLLAFTAAPLVAQDDGAAAPQEFGKVLVETARLRCWPGNVAEPPLFEDVLAQGQIVALGRRENGFRAVQLPLGPLGYVHKRFTSTDESGEVRTKGNRVAFRYRPKTTEAPVTQLGDGTLLQVLGEQDDWWRVRAAGVDAWLPEAEVQQVAADADAAASQQQLLAQHRAAVDARREAQAAARQRAVQDEADLAAVQQIEAAFQQQLGKPPAEQQLAPVETALANFEQGLDERGSAADAPARQAVATLRERLRAQRWLVDATMVIDNRPQPQPAEPPPPRDGLERLQAIGWLRYENRLGAPGVFYLERGGVRHHLVTCSSGRFELALFLNREIGINGPRRRPVGDGNSVLDVERLEVLGAMRR